MKNFLTCKELIDPLYNSDSYMNTLANSKDPDEMLHNAAFHQDLHCLLRQNQSTEEEIKVGRSKPPLVLTSGFNRLKLPRSICQKVVNTGQYESEWSIENFKWRF